MNNSAKYREYFDIDERYFPCIDYAAINAGAPWENTYPHDTFIRLLTEMERALALQNDRKTLWIEGAYGTGKSQCAHALRKILDAPEEEVRAYWSKYDPLRDKKDLLEKLLTHKKKGIVTVYRYASGGIRSPRDLFFAIQESVKDALVQQNVSYLGENTLKEGIIEWLEDPDHKVMFNSLLENPNKDWGSLFSQSTADEVLDSLRNNSEMKSLVDKIFHLADKEGVIPFNIDADKLIKWLTEIIDRNDIRIVFIWDEFSDYFTYNRESLSEFQKIVALVQDKQFYFIVVTHEPQKIYISDHDKGNQVKVSSRFISISIALPDKTAFELIGHAFKVKHAAQGDWESVASDLSSRTNSSRTEVMKAAKTTDEKIMKNIMPIHPLTALLLKNIASAFQSNQRSMFDFIKTSNTDDVKAFQWFIDNTSPYDDTPLLTVDMLWNFFYEKGRENLSSDIRFILDVFPQQKDLRNEERAVLKAILIMQAIDQRLGGVIDLFKATDQNLSYVFEGISALDTSCKGIAKGLKEKGILVLNPIGEGRYAYAAAVLAGDQAKIDRYKKELKENCSTLKLATEGGLADVLALSAALRLRFETEPNTGKLTVVTMDNFTKETNNFQDVPMDWKFHAIIAFAKDDKEAVALRKTIKERVADEKYKHIVFVDALSTPLGSDAFEEYLNYSAMSKYYSGNNNTASRENAYKATQVLSQNWKNSIYDGKFLVYTYDNQEGEKFSRGEEVLGALQLVVSKRFKYVFDFTEGLTGPQFTLSNLPFSAKSGIKQSTGGIVAGIEKHLLPQVWLAERYWENPTTAALSISKIKADVDRFINDSFDSDSGRISIGDIYDFLKEKYGFAPCNLYAFLAGFLLKEYSGEPFRSIDLQGKPDPMDPEKLGEILGNYIKGSAGGKTPNPAYIVKMTAEEKAFYGFTEKAWNISTSSFSSVEIAATAIRNKMRALKFPVWCLSEVDGEGVFDVVEKYIELVQSSGGDTHKIGVEIGEIALIKPDLHDKLPAFITPEKCQEGMKKFLLSFADGEILKLAAEIGTENRVLKDIQDKFDVKYACLWDKNTGEGEISKLLIEYNIVKQTNIILNSAAHSLSEAYKEWIERLKFLKVSQEALSEKFSGLKKALDYFLEVYNDNKDELDFTKNFLQELAAHGAKIKELFDDSHLFFAIYAPYLEGLSADELGELKSKIPTDLFDKSRTKCNEIVKEKADEFRKNQLKTQLFALWKSKTSTKNPREWSAQYKTPILCCISADEYSMAKKMFETLNRGTGSESEIKSALEFLRDAKLFEDISDESKRNSRFAQSILGSYSVLFPELDEIREILDRVSIDVYEWHEHRGIKDKVKELAEAKYYAGGSDKVLMKIDEMDNDRLKEYLKLLVKKSIAAGIEILTDGGEAQDGD
jgi:hypothetical protein